MSMQNLGAAAFRECFSSGGDIAAHLNTLIKAPVSQPTSEMLCGALGEMTRIYQCMRAAGHVPRFQDKDVDAFMHTGPNIMAQTITMKLNPVDDAWLSKNLSNIIGQVHTLRHTVVFTTPETTPPPVPMPSEPLLVKILSMPDRVIESNVSYDNAGNITSTTQTESDASAGAA